MPAVLGIDAAWTPTQPSGVALAAKGAGRWRLIAMAPSYQRFLALADASLTAEARPSGSILDVLSLLRSATALAGRNVDAVAIDMPMAHFPISGRRASDKAVSRAYGARKCSTHSPSATRPGPLSDKISAAFLEAGYPLQTSEFATPGLIEVYPHPALVELTGALERLPYKKSKTKTYWRSCNPAERRLRLYEKWEEIAEVLDREIDGVVEQLPRLAADAPGVALKAYEDMLDAAVCAWVAICALEGRALPFGDEFSAIWVPKPCAQSDRPVVKAVDDGAAERANVV